MRNTGPTPKTRALVRERERDACGYCGCALNGGGETQHRRARAMGGSRATDTNSPANLILLCSEHHRYAEGNPVWAATVGLRVAQNQNPAAVPVLYRGSWRHLLPDGGLAVAVTVYPESEESA